MNRASYSNSLSRVSLDEVVEERDDEGRANFAGWLEISPCYTASVAKRGSLLTERERLASLPREIAHHGKSLERREATASAQRLAHLGKQTSCLFTSFQAACIGIDESSGLATLNSQSLLAFQIQRRAFRLSERREKRSTLLRVSRYSNSRSHNCLDLARRNDTCSF